MIRGLVNKFREHDINEAHSQKPSVFCVRYDIFDVDAHKSKQMFRLLLMPKCWHIEKKFVKNSEIEF